MVCHHQHFCSHYNKSNGSLTVNVKCLLTWECMKMVTNNDSPLHLFLCPPEVQFPFMFLLPSVLLINQLDAQNLVL